MAATLTVDAPSRPRLVTPGFLIVVLAGLGFFGAMGTVVPLLPRYAKESLGAGSVAVGAVVGAFALSAIVTRPLSGHLGDTKGRRLPMRLGAVIAGLSIAAYGLATSVPALIGMRLVTGIGEGLFFVAALSLITDLTPPARRGEAVSYFSVAVYLGIGLGPMLGEALHRSASYRVAFAAAGALGIAAAVIALFAPRTPLPERPPHAEKRRLIHPAALAPGAVLALGLIGFAGFQTFVPLYVERFRSVDAGLVFLLYSGVVLAVRLLGARIPDRVGAGPVATTALVLVGVGLLIVAAVPTPFGLYGGTAVLAVGMALQYPALVSLAVSRAPEHDRASVLGTFSSFFDLATGFGGPVIGVAAAVGGYRIAFATGAVLSFVGIVVHRAQLARHAERVVIHPEPAVDVA